MSACDDANIDIPPMKPNSSKAKRPSEIESPIIILKHSKTIF